MRTLSLLLGVAALLANLPARAESDVPRLVVVVSIDQLPRDYLDRFAPLFGKNGFARMTSGGADFRQAHHTHFVTATAPGHAVMLTGAYPRDNGIVGNWWYSRELRRPIPSVTDERSKPVGSKFGDGGSAVALTAPSVGDVLRVATGGRAKVIAASIKDRGAIMMGGQRPNAAYWYDPSTCRFVSSTYYMTELPKWVESFNASGACARYIGRNWERLGNAEDYERFAGPDDMPYERAGYGFGNTFPHPVKEGSEGKDRFAAVVGTPFGGELLLAFARAAIEAESLGADGTPDLLALSFSSNDYIGHGFGPHSQEVLDVTLRTDAVLGELMEYLDRRVGEGKWTIALTSDHGVAPVAEYLEETGLAPRRADHYRFDTASVRSNLERALAEDFFGGDPAPAGFGGFIEAWEKTEPFVYFDRVAIEKLRPPPSLESVERAAKAALKSADGIERVYMRSELPALSGSGDRFEQMVYRNWHSERGGDLLVQLEPYWIVSDKRLAASHGQPYRYDTHVPLILYGAGVATAIVDRPVAVVDLASTVSRLLGITPPAKNSGEPLVEALRSHRLR